MSKKVAIIGAGINGLVAANYLQRNGYSVTILEKNLPVGGACASDSVVLQDKRLQFANGASVLGMMQDFVFQETGLAKEIQVYAPRHPAIVYFEHDPRPCFMYEDAGALAKELKDKWNETGDVEGFYKDMGLVVRFLTAGYKMAEVPTLKNAIECLGSELVETWISGSARQLLDRYFTSEAMKVFLGMDVVESGPVPLDSPYSAFNIPLMSSGTIFGGNWGFVKGRMWKVAEALAAINTRLGVEILSSSEVVEINQKDMVLEYNCAGTRHSLSVDYLVFASDPLTAARLVDEPQLSRQVAEMSVLGTSGKLVMFFKQPVVWKDTSGGDDFDLAFRFVISCRSLKELEEGGNAVAGGQVDFTDGFCEIYCEGAGMRHHKEARDYDVLSVFLKNLALSKPGVELPAVKSAVAQKILQRIENPGDLIDSILFTPRDLQTRFGFPGGNIDHVELCNGQTFFWRNYSPDPARHFFQFGQNERILYCAAGAYPCGSIAGTPGYMCAMQMIGNYSPEAAAQSKSHLSR